MNNDLVSVIMPSYNTGKFIKESICSVISQSYNNWELIIVDDCSTDNTDEIVSLFDDKRIKYYKNAKNCGAAASRNKAISKAKGRFIAFLDSDDLWKSDKLEKQISFMESNNYVFTYTNYERIDEMGKPINLYCTGPKVITKSKMYRYCYPGCLTVVYDKKAVGDLQIKEIEKNNDYAMWLKVSKIANCYLLNDNLAKYRIRSKSISHDKISIKIKSHYNLFRFCDEKPVLIALWFALRNMWYGFLKKKRYEEKKH